MSETSTCQIPAVKTKDQPEPQRRLVIVTDVSVFHDGDSPVWSADRIEEVMSWTDINQADGLWARLTVADPSWTPDDDEIHTLRSAWRLWVQRKFEHGYNYLTLPMLGSLSYDLFECADNYDRLVVPFYGKRYFDQFVDDPAPAVKDWREASIWVMTVHHAWLSLIKQCMGHLYTRGWYDQHGLKDVPLQQRFAEGQTAIPTSPEYDGSDRIAEVVLLSRNPETSELRPQAFSVPRAFDPAGDLP